MKRNISLLKQAWDRMSGNFRNKITLAATLLLVLFMAVGFVEMYLFTRATLLERIRSYMRGEAAAVSINLGDSIREIEDVTLSVLGNTSIQTKLRALKNDGLDAYSSYRYENELREELGSYALLRTEIASVSLVDREGNVYRYSKNRKQVYDRLSEYASDIYARDGRVIWFANDSSYQDLFCARAITSLPDFETLGYVAVGISGSYLKSLYEELIPAGMGEVYLLDEKGVILSSIRDEHLGETLGGIFAPLIEQQGEGYHVCRNGDSIYVSEAMDNGWRLVLLVPKAYYLSGMTRIGVIFLVSVLAISTLGVLAIRSILRPLTKPLYQLAEAMEEFGHGNLEVRSTVESGDEIGMLSDTFNKMVEDMHRLYIAAYEKELMRQDIELRALQMQINPHFLYNTLDTINWTARFNGADQVGDMACSLGNLLRYSLLQGDFTVLSREMVALQDYLAIQNCRYGDKMTVELDVPSSFGNIDVPKLLIQPIVENAIVHGIEEKLENGRIRIWVELEQEDLLIHVDDDGVGMTAETAASLLQEQTDRDFRRSAHIGVYNVHRRLQMYYGEGYGVTIQSQLGQGTQVTLRIKALREPDL